MFPVQPANKSPYSNASVAAARGIALPPDRQGGANLATRDPVEIQKLWTAFPEARIGIATGMLSGGLIALDVDRKNGKDGLATLSRLQFAIPATVWQQTPSGGFHYLYRDVTGKPLPTDAGVIGDGLDRRGDGGYIVDYGLFDLSQLPAPAPEWLLAGSRNQRERHALGDLSKAGPSYDAVLQALSSHDPNDLDRTQWVSLTAAFKQAAWTLVHEAQAKQDWNAWCSRYAKNDPADNNKLWKSIRDSAVGYSAMIDRSPEGMFGINCKPVVTPNKPRRTYEQILDDAHNLNFDPIDTDKVEQLCIEAGTLQPIKKDALLRAIRNQTQLSLSTLRSQACQAETEGEADHLQLARKTKAAIGESNLIYAENFLWLFASTGVWKRCDDREMKQRVQAVMDADHLAVTATRVTGVADVLKNEIYKPHHQFNLGNPETVNCLNGELELQDGVWVLLPHRKELYRTTQIPVLYDRAAEAPLFRQFLHEIFRDDADRNEKALLVLEMMGYSLMSHANREKFMLLIGAGANGKSVLLATVEALLGKDNVAAVQPDSFDNKFQRAHLHQKLANIVTELKQGEIIADAELKAIVSGEKITVEHKNKDPHEMRSHATCWFGTNHMPRTRDFSDALFRRANIIEFNRVFSPYEQDTGLKNKLFLELPGILNLALWAYGRVVATNSFTIPTSSREALNKWKLEADQVAQFVEGACKPSPESRVSIEELYNAYRVWSLTNGIRNMLKKQSLGDRLERLGYSRVKGTGGVRTVSGLILG